MPPCLQPKHVLLSKREKEGVDMRTLQAKGTKAFLTNWYLSISAVANIWLAPEWLWSMDTANSCVGAYWHMEQVHIRRLEQALNQSVLFLFSLSSKYLKCFAGFFHINAGFLFQFPGILQWKLDHIRHIIENTLYYTQHNFHSFPILLLSNYRNIYQARANAAHHLKELAVYFTFPDSME